MLMRLPGLHTCQHGQQRQQWASEIYRAFDARHYISGDAKYWESMPSTKMRPIYCSKTWAHARTQLILSYHNILPSVGSTAGNSSTRLSQPHLWAELPELYDASVFQPCFFTDEIIQLVPSSSAVLPGTINAEPVGMHKDHTGLTKFSSEDDGDFEVIANHLLRMSRTAPKEIEGRWDAHRQREGTLTYYVVRYNLTS